MSSDHADHAKQHSKRETSGAGKDLPAGDSNTTKSSNPATKSTNSSSTLLNRIQKSATSLIQDTFAPTSAGAALMSTDLADIRNSSNKQSFSTHSSSSSSTYFRNHAMRGPGLSLTDHDPYTGSSANNHMASVPTALDGEESFASMDIDSFQRSGYYQAESEFFANATKTNVNGKGKGKLKQQQQQQDSSGLLDSFTGTAHPLFDVNEYDSSIFSEYELAWITVSRMGTMYNTRAASSSAASTTTKDTDSSSTAEDQEIQSLNQTIHIDEATDGAAVVDLLSDPSFQPGFLIDDVSESSAYTGEVDNNNNNHSHDLFAFGANHDYDPFDENGYPISTILDSSPRSLDISISNILDNQQLNQATTTTTDANTKRQITPYSLIPDIDSFLSQRFDNNQESTRTAADPELLRQSVLADLVGAEEWLRLDERYHDEVWGYLRPALEAAAAEIKEKKKNAEMGTGKTGSEDGDGDGPAVKRLKMILRHVSRL